jgi:hypothetical protein
MRSPVVLVETMAEVMDRQMASQPHRMGRGTFFGSGATKPRPKRKIQSRGFPPRGSRPFGQRTTQ